MAWQGYNLPARYFKEEAFLKLCLQTLQDQVTEQQHHRDRTVGNHSWSPNIRSISGWNLLGASHQPNPLKLKKTKKGETECSFHFVLFCNWDMMVTAGQIYGGKQLGSWQCVQRLLNSWKENGILVCFAISQCVVHTGSQAAICLPHQDCRRGIGAKDCKNR